MTNNPLSEKELIRKRLTSLKRFNDWEKKQSETMGVGQNIYAIFELYDLIPENARQRDVNVSGIIKMRKALACLK